MAEEQLIANELNITAIPHMRLFRHGKPSLKYIGEHKAEDMTEWLLRKTGSPVLTVNDSATATAILNENKIVVIGFFDDLTSTESQMYLEAVDIFDDFVFLITNHDEVYERYGADNDDIFLFNDYGMDRVYFNDEYSVENIQEFIEIKTTPILVHDFSEYTMEKIFSGMVKSFVFFFFSREQNHYEEHLSKLVKVAGEFVDEAHFVTVNTNKDRNGQVMHLFGVKQTDVPTIRYLFMEDYNRFEKFRPYTTEITEENIRMFINGVLDNEIQPYLKDEKVPEHSLSSPVLELVASTIDPIALDKTKDVVVLFYLPWCKVAKAFEKVYLKIGERYKNSETVTIARINVEDNEALKHHAKKEPVLKLFRSEDNKPVTYEGKLKYDNVIKFIELRGYEEKDEL